MSEEENKAIEEIGLIIESFYDFPNPQSINFNCADVNYLEIVLNLIEKQKRLLELIIQDFQMEGYFKNMSIEDVIKYYEKRKGEE